MRKSCIIAVLAILSGLLFVRAQDNMNCIDCSSPCLYEVTETGDIVAGPYECPAECFCYDYWLNEQTYHFDEASQKYYEGWCYKEPDIPEFGVFSLSLVVIVAGLWHFMR